MIITGGKNFNMLASLSVFILICLARVHSYAVPQIIEESVVENADVEATLANVSPDLDSLQHIAELESQIDSIQPTEPILTLDNLQYPETMPDDLASYMEEIAPSVEAMESLDLALQNSEMENIQQTLNYVDTTLPFINDLEEIDLMYENNQDDNNYLEDVLDFPSVSLQPSSSPFANMLAAESLRNGMYGGALSNIMRPLRTAFPNLQSPFDYARSPLAGLRQFPQYARNNVPFFRLSKRSPIEECISADYDYEGSIQSEFEGALGSSGMVAAESAASMRSASQQMQSAAAGSQMGMMESGAAKIRALDDAKFDAMESVVDNIIALNDKKLDMIDSVADKLESMHEGMSLGAIRSVADTIRTVDDIKMGALRSTFDGIEAIKDMKMDALQSVARSIDSTLGLGSSNFSNMENLINTSSLLSSSDKSQYLRELSQFSPTQLDGVSEMLGLLSNPQALLHHELENVNLAKMELRAATEAIAQGDMQSASSHILSIVSHLQDSCPICRTLKQCLRSDPSMLPFTLNMSETLLNGIPY